MFETLVKLWPFVWILQQHLITVTERLVWILLPCAIVQGMKWSVLSFACSFVWSCLRIWQSRKLFIWCGTITLKRQGRSNLLGSATPEHCSGCVLNERCRNWRTVEALSAHVCPTAIASVRGNPLFLYCLRHPYTYVHHYNFLKITLLVLSVVEYNCVWHSCSALPIAVPPYVY